ncbi:unnamed protein product [Mytilus coruscus]|uniref:Uncharacterized protein n=1 Tax=Mytilus coruscus TaxID=42192 RepID=A0A6J8D4S1_MYTCO|nr:unnamed protein product [Mytilus coruscus]
MLSIAEDEGNKGNNMYLNTTLSGINCNTEYVFWRIASELLHNCIHTFLYMYLSEYSEYVKNETFSTGNKVVNQSHTIDQLQLQNTTPIFSSEFDSSLQRPETLPSRNISRKRHRRRRYDYEDSHDWNYDLEDLDYDENNFAVVTCVVRTCVGPSVPSVVCSFLTVSIYADYVDVSKTIQVRISSFIWMYQGRSSYVFLNLCGCIKDDPGTIQERISLVMWMYQVRSRFVFLKLCECIKDDPGTYFLSYVDISRTIEIYVFLKLCGRKKEDPAYNQMKFICKAMGMELDYKTYLNMKQSLEETIIEQGSDPNNLAKLAG